MPSFISQIFIFFISILDIKNQFHLLDPFIIVSSFFPKLRLLSFLFVCFYTPYRFFLFNECLEYIEFVSLYNGKLNYGLVESILLNLELNLMEVLLVCG